MRCGVAFSPAGARALANAGSLDLVLGRGASALTAARGLGLDAVSTDAPFDTTVAQELDRGALVTARSWRPGPISPLLPDVDVGLLAEYDLIYVAGRILRLAAALEAVPGKADLIVATAEGSPEALVAEAVARAKGWRLQLMERGGDTPTLLDIAARGRRSPSLGRRLARYWLARLRTLGRGQGSPVASYIFGETTPLLLGLARAGVARLVLDPTEPPPRAVSLSGRVRGAAWAGGKVASARHMRLPAPPPLAWKGIDLTAALACGLERVIGGQLVAWRRYGEELLTSWKHAGVRAVIVYNDCTSTGRTRVLVAERLGVPSIVVQHGMLAWIGDRNHEVGDYSAVWGDRVVDDFAARGIAPDRVGVVGWPTANVRLPELRHRGEAGSDGLALILTTDLPVGTALVPEDAVERAGVGAIEAIRGAGWRGRVVAKIHPSQDSASHRQLFAEAGHPDVEVYGGRTDPWPLMARASVVVTASTSIACALPHLGKSAVLYDLVRPPYAPYLARFSDFADAATAHAAKEEVARSIEGKSTVGGGMPCGSVVDYASEVRNADERFAEIVRRATRQGPVAEGALQRALNADTVHPLAFDHLPIRRASESLKS